MARLARCRWLMPYAAERPKSHVFKSAISNFQGQSYSEHWLQVATKYSHP